MRIFWKHFASVLVIYYTWEPLHLYMEQVEYFFLNSYVIYVHKTCKVGIYIDYFPTLRIMVSWI